MNAISPALFGAIGYPVAGRWRVFLRVRAHGEASARIVGPVDVDAHSEAGALRAAVAQKFLKHQAAALAQLSPVSIARLAK